MRAYPIVTGCDIEDGQEGKPDNAGGVHGEANELGLIEVLWTLPGLESIPSGTQNHSLEVRIQKWHYHFGTLLMMPLDEGIPQGECFHSVVYYAKIYDRWSLQQLSNVFGICEPQHFKCPDTH